MVRVEVQKNESYDLSSMRVLLEEQRRDLVKRIARLAVENTPQAVSDSDRSALAQRYVSQQRRSNRLAQAERMLAQVEAALRRLEAGSYGKCSACGELIQSGRLQALPYTELCVNCQEKREKRLGVG